MAQQHLTAETVDREAVARVAANVQLLDVRLVMHHAALNRDHHEIPIDWASKARLGVDCHVGTIEGDRTLFTVHGFFFVEFWGDESQKPETQQDEGDTPPDVDISLVYELDYELKEKNGISEDDLEHFAYLNARFNAWPYFRQTVQASTTQMGIRPLLVPVHTVRPIAIPTPE